MSELIQHGGLKPGLCVHLLPGRVILVVKHAGLATPIHTSMSVSLPFLPWVCWGGPD